MNNQNLPNGLIADITIKTLERHIKKEMLIKFNQIIEDSFKFKGRYIEIKELKEKIKEIFK